MDSYTHTVHLTLVRADAEAVKKLERQRAHRGTPFSRVNRQKTPSTRVLLPKTLYYHLILAPTHPTPPHPPHPTPPQTPIPSPLPLPTPSRPRELGARGHGSHTYSAHAHEALTRRNLRYGGDVAAETPLRLRSRLGLAQSCAAPARPAANLRPHVTSRDLA